MTPCPKKKRKTLTKKQESELRVKVWAEQGGRCYDCGNWVDLKGETIFNTAHLAHVKSKGAGGNDTEENRVIKCYRCHIEIEHGPRWSAR